MRYFTRVLVILLCLSGQAILAGPGPTRSDGRAAGPQPSLLPEPVPASVLGGLGYYRWRHQDFLRRHPWLREPDPAHIPDYYLDYGEKYAVRFSRDLHPRLSGAGQAWLVRTRLGLQEAIEQRCRQDPAAFARLEEDPPAFRRFAFDTHVSAYMDAGLADLALADLVKIGAFPDLQDILRRDGRSQVFAIARRLGKAYLTRILVLTRQVQALAGGAVRNGDPERVRQTIRFVEGLSPADRAMVRIVTLDYRELKQALRFQVSHGSQDPGWQDLLDRLQALSNR